MIVALAQSRAFDEDSIRRADATRFFCHIIDERECGFLVRHGKVCACKATFGQRAQFCGEILGFHWNPDIATLDPVIAQVSGKMRVIGRDDRDTTPPAKLDPGVSQGAGRVDTGTQARCNRTFALAASFSAFQGDRAMNQDSPRW